LKNNFYNPPQLKFFPLGTAVLYEKLAGAGTWDDTDCSAELGTDQTKIWVINVMSTAGSNPTVGARPHGSGWTNQIGHYQGFSLFVPTDADGHIDFYQDAGASNWYKIMGYLKNV